MKTSVIICEFNPLHYGHKRLIDFAKTISDKVICVMSGNFVERGMPAVANKYKRAVHAVRVGADLVVELPTLYATASAEDFALGGVMIANALNADFLVFGSECGEIAPLKECAEMLDDSDVNARIRQEMQKGVSYPKAVASVCGEILDKPNNTLAVEYLRALKRTASDVIPVTICREDNFNGAPQQFASATFLRNAPTQRGKYTFDFVCKDIDDTIESKYCEFATRFLATVDKNYLENIAGVTEGLHNRIFVADKSQGYEKLMEQLKTKRYTRLKLQRVVLNTILGITKQCVEHKNTLPALKVLAVKTSETRLLALPALNAEGHDTLTERADRLYSTFDGEQPPTKLIKIQ